jgi:hypothetical protein
MTLYEVFFGWFFVFCLLIIIDFSKAIYKKGSFKSILKLTNILINAFSAFITILVYVTFKTILR